MFSTNKKNQNTVSSFDVRESTGPIGLLKFLIAISLLITVFIFCLKVYQGGVRDRSEPPTIAGDKTPFKVILEEQGGVETPDQDKNIYSKLDFEGKSENGEIINIDGIPLGRFGFPHYYLIDKDFNISAYHENME